MTNILVTGGSGQIGSDLKLFKNINNQIFFFPSSSEVDITKIKSVNSFIKENIDNFHIERKFMKKWLNSNSQSYNFFKSLNYDLWNKN